MRISRGLSHIRAIAKRVLTFRLRIVACWLTDADATGLAAVPLMQTAHSSPPRMAFWWLLQNGAWTDLTATGGGGGTAPTAANVSAILAAARGTNPAIDASWLGNAPNTVPTAANISAILGAARGTGISRIENSWLNAATTGNAGIVRLATALSDTSDIPSAGQVTAGLALKQDKLPDGTASQVLTWSGGAWTAQDAPSSSGGNVNAAGLAAILGVANTTSTKIDSSWLPAGEESMIPNFLRAFVLRGDPRVGSPNAFPAGKIYRGRGTPVEVTDNPSYIVFPTAAQDFVGIFQRENNTTGTGNFHIDFQDPNVDYTQCKMRGAFTLSRTGQQVGFYIGTSSQNFGSDGYQSGETVGTGMLFYVEPLSQGRATLRVLRLDAASQALDDDPSEVNEWQNNADSQNISLDAGTLNVSTSSSVSGANEMEVQYLKGNIRVLINDEEVFTATLSQANQPDVSGAGFGCYLELQSGNTSGGFGADNQFQLDSIYITDITDDDITGHTHVALTAADIPALDAAKITTGTFAAARIPTLAQSKITGLTTALNNRVTTTAFTQSLGEKQNKLPDGTNSQVLTWTNGAWEAQDAPSGGGGGTDTNSYFIDAWIEVPKSVETISSSALTSAGTWNNDPAAPGFVTNQKPTTSVAGGVVRDNKDLPANSTTSTTRNYHHFKRIFTVGETGVQASAWDYMGQWNHEEGSPRRYLINAYLRILSGDTPAANALTSGGVWSDQSQSFTTKPTFGSIIDGAIYDDSDLPADAARSADYDYWRFTRYFTEGEGTIAGSAWRRISKLDQDPATGGGGKPTDVRLYTAPATPVATTDVTIQAGDLELIVLCNQGAGGGETAAGDNANMTWTTTIPIVAVKATTGFFGGIGRGASNFAVKATRAADTNTIALSLRDLNTASGDGGNTIEGVWVRR